MFSKELLELDRNTAQYMIDKMQKEIDVLKTENVNIPVRRPGIFKNDSVRAKYDSAKAEIERYRQMLAAHGIDADSVE